MEKFFVVVRADLDPGLQMAQACHAAYALGVSSPKPERQNIAVLGATKAQLEALVHRVVERGDCHQAFYEPDLEGELTAGAFDGSVRKLVSSLPKALRRSVPEEQAVDWRQ
jgi:hypothetical protein